MVARSTPTPELTDEELLGGLRQPSGGGTVPTSARPSTPSTPAGSTGLIGDAPVATPKLTRQEIGKLSDDPRIQRQLEQLFSQVGGSVETVDQVTSDAAVALAQSNEALFQLTRIADALSMLAMQPPTPEPRQSLAMLLDVLLSSPAANDVLIFDGDRWGNSASIEAALTNTTGRLVDSSATLSDGAAGNTGTLTNAPASGDPTKWVAIDDNGVTRYVPAW